MICSTRTDCPTCAGRRRKIAALMAEHGMSRIDAEKAERKSRDPFNPKKLDLTTDQEIAQFLREMRPEARAELVEKMMAGA